jgi:hypothetical protein
MSNVKPRFVQTKVGWTTCKKLGHDSSKCWFNKEKDNKPPMRTGNMKSLQATECAYALAELKELFDNLPLHQLHNLTPRKNRKLIY